MDSIFDLDHLYRTYFKMALALVFSALLLTGCSSYGDVETLLRAPQLSGESSALQKALNSSYKTSTPSCGTPYL